MPILLCISAISQICGSDAITFVRFKNSLEVTNIAGPVFDLRNTIVDYLHQFHYLFVEFTICHFNSRWSHDTIVAFEDLKDSAHFVLVSLNYAIYHQTSSPSFSVRRPSFDHFDLLFHWFYIFGGYSWVHVFQITYPLAVPKDFLRSWKHSLKGMKGALAFFHPNKEWLEGCQILLASLKGLTLRVCSASHIALLIMPSMRLRLLKIAIMTFLQLWASLS